MPVTPEKATANRPRNRGQAQPVAVSESSGPVDGRVCPEMSKLLLHLQTTNVRMIFSGFSLTCIVSIESTGFDSLGFGC